MKRIMMVVFGLVIAVNAFAAKKTVALTELQEADKLYAERNAVTDTAKANEGADKCIAAYKKLFETSPSDELLFKYMKAIDFKNFNFVTDIDQKKTAYKALLAMVDKFCEGNSLCASSNYIAYSYMTAWGRYGEIIDILEAATSGIAGKVKDYAERIYASDKTFKDWAASYALGRLHYMVPNIVFMLTWPDKNLSRKYLEEYNAANPADITGKMYLADTLWDLGDREKAAALYKEGVNTQLRKTDYIEDLKDRETCAARAKEQGVQ